MIERKAPPRVPDKQSIKKEAHRLGFVLAGFTTPDPPPHLPVFENWLMQGRHASMDYLAGDRSRARRANPRSIMPECRSILVLATPYSDPSVTARLHDQVQDHNLKGKIAGYAWGEDYHAVLVKRMARIVTIIQAQVDLAVAYRWYTDTGPILERDLAQRAGLGWVGKNTCLINPGLGSYFLLSEILLDLDIEPDDPFTADRCGKCTRCIVACPTRCILPDRTIDAGRCISYLTIEHRDRISPELRASMGPWVFGCDICQLVCPWNRFAVQEGDAAFRAGDGLLESDLLDDLQMTPAVFQARFARSPLKRAKPEGYRRNLIVALGNQGDSETLPALEKVALSSDDSIREHAVWAIGQIQARTSGNE